MTAGNTDSVKLGEADWIAYIEKGWLLWGWTVERSESYWDEPRNGVPMSRGNSLHGFAFSQDRARRKARKMLRNRIEWSKPRRDARIVVTLEDR